MLRFLATRLARAALTIAMVVTFAFVVLRLSGDPAQIIMGADAPPEAVEAFPGRLGPRPAALAAILPLLRRDPAGRPRPIHARRARRDRAGRRTHPGHPRAHHPGAAHQAGDRHSPQGIYAALHRNSLIDRLVMVMAVAGFTRALPSCSG
jgi:peptide/nickel transport system permease protein